MISVKIVSYNRSFATRFKRDYHCASSQTFLIIGAKGSRFIGFNPVLFDAKNLCIKRPSIDDRQPRKINEGKITVKYSPELDGLYTLVKENEDLYYLEKV